MVQQRLRVQSKKDNNRQRRVDAAKTDAMIMDLVDFLSSVLNRSQQSFDWLCDRSPVIRSVCDLFTQRTSDKSCDWLPLAGTCACGGPLELDDDTNWTGLPDDEFGASMPVMLENLCDREQCGAQLNQMQYRVAPVGFAGLLWKLCRAAIASTEQSNLLQECRTKQYYLATQRDFSSIKYIALPWLYRGKWRMWVLTNVGSTFVKCSARGCVLVCVKGDELGWNELDGMAKAITAWAGKLRWEHFPLPASAEEVEVLAMPLQHRLGGSACCVLQCMRLLLQFGGDTLVWKAKLRDSYLCARELHGDVDEIGVCILKLVKILVILHII